MKQVPRNITVPALVLIVINILGLLWIHSDLTNIRPATVLAKDVRLRPDNVEPDRLRVNFDRQIVADDEGGQIEKEAVFALKPHGPGVWKWSTPDTLEYLFDTPLPPGRRFTLEATDEFESRTGMSLDGKKSFEIRTISLALANNKIIAVDPRHVTVELEFNQPVDPADLLRHVRFFDETRPDTDPFDNVLCLTQNIQKKLVVRVPRPASNRLRIVLEQNLAGPNADLSLDHTVVRNLQIGTGFCYLSNYISVPRFEETTSIRLRFSHRLNREQELPEIRTTPQVEDLKGHRSHRELVLSGKFAPETRYTVHVPATLMSYKNETLGEDCPVTVEIPARRPALMFAHRRGILAPHGNLSLDIKAVNVTGVEFLTWQLHENNLVSYLHGESRRATSRSMPKKTIDFETVRNEIHDFVLDIDELIEPGPGVYYITAQSVKPRWTSSNTIITVTDLAITAKTQQDGCLVWVTSLRTGKPVKRAKVRAVSYNNQVLTTARTDSDGIALLEYADNNPDGSMWVITAKKGEDLSYLRAGDNRWLIDDVDQSGRAYPDDIEVMLYAERGAYRPGGTIHLTGIVRRRTGDIPPAFPFSVKVTRPDGREIADMKAVPAEDSQGIFHVSLPTETDCQTGPYRFQTTLPGDNKTLGATTAFVEAFLPQRMKVQSEPAAERFDPNDTPRISVSARYLWDVPVADVGVKVEASLLPSRFRSQNYKGFTFGMPKTGRIHVKTVKDTLDDEGKATLKIPLPANLAPAVYNMSMTATVTEPGARSVSSNSSAVVDRLGHHLGLRCAADQLVSPAEPITIEWISLTGDDKPRDPNDLHVKLDLVEFDTVLKEVNGRRVWRSVERVKEIKTQQIPAATDAGGSFEITCPDVGRYRLTITDGETGSRTRLKLYASESGARQSLAMNQPERLEIVIDKDKYLPGARVKVLIRSPVSGTLLATVESDRVSQWQIAEVINNTAELEFDLSEKLRGGAFITATVVRAVDPDKKSWLPHRAMGMKRLVFDHEAKRLPVTIGAVEKSGPGESIPIAIQTAPAIDPNLPGMVHLWAVDEGILLPTAYETPDPHRYFLSPRRSAVFTSDLFYRLLPDYDRPETITRIGAGGGYEMGRLRRNPVSTVRREPDVVWRKAISVDAAGNATVEMKLPDLIGQMRLMAVAVDHDRYGNAHEQVILTSDLIAESNWPRFAAPGDTFEVPVKLFNSTDEAISVVLEAKVDGPIEIENLPAEPIEISPEKPLTRLLKVKALEIGPVQVQITAKQTDSVDNPLTATSKAAFSVRPATALHGEVALKSIDAGEQLQIDPSESFMPGTQQLTINISSRPGVQLAPALEKLVRYPYGCVEQTTSRLFSLLYATEILGKQHAGRINQMVQAGIARLWSMQTRSGGLSYWPGGTNPNLWGSAYAGWCLLECKNAGHDVDQRFSEELMKYLESQLHSTTHGSDFNNTRALLCRVLSTFDKPSHGWMNRLAEQKDSLDLAAIAHLAGAFHAAGKTDAAMKLLPAEMMDMTVETTTSGRLTSQLQQRAVWLSVLLEIDPDHEMVVPLVNLIMESRKNGCWSSTLNNSAAIVALSRYQVLATREECDFTGLIEIADSNSIGFDHNKTLVHKVEDFSKPLTITSNGKGRIYIALSSEGLARKGLIEPYDRRLSVRRRWHDRTGRRINPNDIHVGDLVKVEVQIVTTEKRRIDNIAVVDALAGGMEIENPRFATSAASARSSGGRPDHIELLDDRVVLFCSVSKNKRIFRYALRATTAGLFDLPPIQASCMYDPSIASLGKTGTVTILP